MTKFDFPTEIIYLICQFLDTSSLKVANQLNYTWYSASKAFLYSEPIFYNCDKFYRFLNCLSSEITFKDNTRIVNGAIFVKKIDFSYTNGRWNDLKDEHIVQLISICPNIIDINLNLCNIGSISIEKIAKNYGKKLQKLSLEGCKAQDNAFLPIATYCYKLKYLDLSQTDISDRTLLRILETCKDTLLEISLESCNCITDIGIKPLLEMPQLTFVNLEGCFGILNDVHLGVWEEEEVEFI